jgi:hypothetical protein
MFLRQFLSSCDMIWCFIMMSWGHFCLPHSYKKSIPANVSHVSWGGVAAARIPFCSVSPKRMKILDWYLQGWCIRGQRCVAWCNRGDVTFDLGAVILNLKFPFTLYLLNKCRFWIGICSRVLASIKFKHPKKHVATTTTHRLREIFLVKCQKQAFPSIKGKQKCIAMHFCMFWRDIHA